MKRKKKIFCLLLLFFFLVGLTASIIFYYFLVTPYKSYSGTRIVVTVVPGSSLDQIANLLWQRGVIRHPWLLKSIFYYHGTQQKGKAGEYVFDRPLTPFEVYEKLLRGETQYIVLTIPEGTSIFEMESILQLEKDCSPEEFRLALKSPVVSAELQSIDPAITSVEGFLFPETYFFGRKDSVEKILLVMIREFKKRYGEKERKRAQELGFTTLQVVTLASLVEKETSVPSERPLISGVFYNRLKRSMLLQCDPTVIYALRLEGEYKGFIRKVDLQREHPYNTYMKAGLPPGPICNPGWESIRAALYPQQTDKLYFVSKNDGTHYFSATLNEHNRAVNQYQRKR